MITLILAILLLLSMSGTAVLIGFFIRALTREMRISDMLIHRAIDRGKNTSPPADPPVVDEGA